MNGRLDILKRRYGKLRHMNGLLPLPYAYYIEFTASEPARKEPNLRLVVSNSTIPALQFKPTTKEKTHGHH